MTNHAKINFIIDHIDPLGQGVCKKDDKVYFIPKTLPNETGTAKIIKSKKGVHFAELENIDVVSEAREEATCGHYNQCHACHYQHCSYEKEIQFKTQSFSRMLRFLNFEDCPKVIKSDERFHYRNRVQLHYNLKSQKIGFLNAKNQITEVPNCIIAKSTVQKEIKNLYLDKNWLKLAPKNKNLGHVEIYDHQGTVQLTWNEKYAKGGFTQVNQSMNLKLNSLVSTLISSSPNQTIFDLFGGNGNLSKSLEGNKYILDFYKSPTKNPNFFHCDLFDENSISSFRSQTNIDQADWFIVDPPRKGFGLLNQWCQEYKPEKIVYVSCHPQTMIRDLKNLTGHKIKAAYMLDLFPATYHFEACVIAEKINT